MADLAIARALHVLAIVLWMGGVGLVATVLLPVLRRLPNPAQRIAVFEAVEHRFGAQARLSVIVAGLSGLYMLVRMDAWYRFASLPYWWMHAMVAVWLVFAAMLFVVEPFVARRHFAARAARNPDEALRRLQQVHIVVLVFGLITILGAVAGSQGFLLFG